MKFSPSQKMSQQQIERALEDHNIRPTTQRVDIARVLLVKPQHLSADEVLSQVNKKDALVSKATVYNTLNLFADEGLIKRVVINSNSFFYDSNTEEHHHFYNEDTGKLHDIDHEGISVNAIPSLPEDTMQTGIDVVIRIKNRN